MNEKKGVHYAWLIFAACCCFYAGGLSLTMSLAGVYMLPVSEDLGVSRGSFAMWLTIQSIVAVVLFPLWARLMQTRNLNVVVTVGAAAMVLGVFGFAVSTELWMFYLSGALIGVGFPPITTLVGPMLIQNWFAPKHRGRMLGIAAAFTGVGTFVWAPLFTMLLQNLGWHTAYLINGVVAAVLLLPPAIFVVKLSPAEKGLEPYGYDPADEQGGNDDLAEGVSAGVALKSLGFYVVALAVILLCAMAMGVNNSQPGIAIERLVPLGMDPQSAAMLGATMISVAAVGNILGKVVFGFINDKASTRAAFIVFVIMYLCAVLLLLTGNAVPVLLVGAFLLGTHNALPAVGFPLLIRRIFGSRDYAKIWSYISMPFVLIGGFSTSLVGFMYAATGESYAVPLIVTAVSIVAIGALSIWGCSFIGKYAWTREDRSEEVSGSGDDVAGESLSRA